VSSKRKLTRLVELIGEQPGVRVRRTGEGWFFMLPDGSGTSLHLSQSDSHAMENFRSKLRQSGVEYPDQRRKS
jgi:hypothetical protein